MVQVKLLENPPYQNLPSTKGVTFSNPSFGYSMLLFVRVTQTLKLSFLTLAPAPLHHHHHHHRRGRWSRRWSHPLCPVHRPKLLVESWCGLTSGTNSGDWDYVRLVDLYLNTWNVKSPIFVRQLYPLKPSNYCLKNRALGFPGMYIDIYIYTWWFPKKTAW